MAPARIALIFSAITPPERSAPPFWAGVLGAEGFTLIKRYVKMALIVSLLNLLLALITLGRSWYWFFMMPKRWLRAGFIDLASLFCR